jgi:hypothetical protein
MSQRATRRAFLASSAALTLAGRFARAADEPAASYRTRAAVPPTEGRKPVAVLTTVYRPYSHSHHIAGRFMTGYPLDGKYHVPKHYVRSMFVDQTPETDLSKKHAAKFGYRIARTVADALLEDGKLAVEGVLLIAEHGDYKLNEKGQILYPRFEWFEQVVDAFRKAGRSVPVFCDKHLSYSWDKAKRMVGWADELKFGFMAGSSLPLTWRRPELELPLDSPVEDALVAAYGMTEIYGCHTLETLQCYAERRKDGETGVKAVQFLQGDAVWKAGDAGRWSWDLLDAALARSETLNPGDVRDNATAYPGPTTVANLPPRVFLVEYRDGTRGTVLLLNGHIQDFCFAAKLKGQAKPATCMHYLPMPPGAKYFDAQAAAVEKLLETGKSPHPVERTLLTTGVLDAVMESQRRRGERLETPDLAVSYRAPADSGFLRGSVASGDEK